MGTILGIVIAVPLFLAGIGVVLNLDSAFHEIRKAKLNNSDLNQPGNRIVYIGHSTVLIQLDGINIITDPIFSEKILHVSKRYVEPGIAFENLPKIDVILISHEHYDHFDKASLKQFDNATALILSKGLKNRAEKLGLNDVRELGWWENTKIRDVKITALPIKHFLSHSSSYSIEGNKTIYFAGDTGLNEYFKDIGNKFDIDIALLPMGAYRPHLWFIPGFSQGMRKTHLMPKDITIAQDALKAKVVIPIHWGVFKITGEPIGEPQEKMVEIIHQKNLDSKIKIIEPGELFNLIYMRRKTIIILERNLQTQKMLWQLFTAKFEKYKELKLIKSIWFCTSKVSCQEVFYSISI